jgi:hypothetical protein
MPLLGARALIDIAVPTGIDGSEVLRFQLQDGRSAEEVIAESAAILGEVNEELEQRFGGLYFRTEDQYAIATVGQTSRTKTPRKAEFKRADGVRTEQHGNMLPLWDYEDAVEWTPLYLRRAFRSQIDGDLMLIRDRWFTRVHYDLLRRSLTNDENLIGTNGYDVPWAIGTGMNVNFIPPQYGSRVFSSSHTHFVVKNDSDSGVDYNDLIESMMEELRHHGHRGNLQILVSEDDLDTVVAYSTSGEFVELNPANLTVISGNTNAPVRVAAGEADGIPGELFGYWKSKKWGVAELRYDEVIPTAYALATRSYGINNPRNGLAVREEPGIGFGIMAKPQVTSDVNPELDYIKFEAGHGVGVNDRTNGVAGYIAAGATEWVDPDLS